MRQLRHISTRHGVIDVTWCWRNWTFGIWAGDKASLYKRWGIDLGPLGILVDGRR